MSRVVVVAALLPLLLLLPAQAGQAAVVLQQPSSVDAATGTPPATLLALHASTVVGASGTSATTSAAIRITGPPTGLLKVVHGAVAQDVQATVTARSGFGSAADAVTLTLGTATVLVTQSNALPRSTSVVDLGAAGDLTLSVSGVCVGTCTLTVELRIEPDGAGANPLFVYPYTLIVT